MVSKGTPLLEENDVHVWCFELDRAWAARNDLADSLNSVELERAMHFHFEKHRRRYIAGRAVQRIILAQYLGLQAESLEFSNSAYGKPSLPKSSWLPNIKFNTSFSSNIGTLAVALNVDLGIDLEKINQNSDLHTLPFNEFSPEEYNWIQNLPLDKQIIGFYELWTSKEAYLKGKGLGLSVPLDDFCITILQGDPTLAWSNIDAQDPETWSFRRLKIEEGYASCLATQSEINEVKLIRLEPGQLIEQ